MLKPPMPNSPSWHNATSMLTISPQDIELLQTSNSTSVWPSQAARPMCPSWETPSRQTSHRNCNKQHHLTVLEKYLLDKCSWSALIFNNIDWTAHYMSIKNSSMPHKFTIKFIHGWLPIRNMTHRYHTKYDSKCPSCSHNPEDINHFCSVPLTRNGKQASLPDWRNTSARMSSSMASHREP